MRRTFVKTIAVISGLGLSVSVSAAVIRYFFIRRKVSDSECCDSTVEVRLELPRKLLGYIVGKRGATIRRTREETCTTIKMREQGDELISITICGHPSNVKAASEEIRKLALESMSDFLKDVHVPSNAWVSVVGPNGENVRQISYESKASVAVNFSPREGSPGCYLSVRGTREQLDHALSLIDERIAQSEVVQQSKTVGIAGRSLLENVLPSMSSSMHQEVLQTDSADGFVQVFVSAVQSPSVFWVQPFGPKAAQLDKLISEMTDFYSDHTRCSSLAMPSVLPGDFVAAYFDSDKQWYRALVLSVERMSMKAAATVHFVDFGDSAVVELGMLCKLKSEFLILPMQAIKCCLSGVVPVSDRWSTDAVAMFESLTYVALWKVIMAKPVEDQHHCNITSGCEKGIVKDDIVHVRLIDTNGPVDIDVSEELIKSGHAVPCKRRL